MKQDNPMRTMFIVTQPRQGVYPPKLEVNFRARNEVCARQAELICRELVPEGYKWHATDIRAAHTGGRSSRGKRRILKVIFNQTGYDRLPVPVAKQIFAPAWEASLGGTDIRSSQQEQSASPKSVDVI